MKVERKGIEELTPLDGVELLLTQLRELTDEHSIHFDQDVFDEKEEIKEKILTGKIVYNG